MLTIEKQRILKANFWLMKQPVGTKLKIGNAILEHIPRSLSATLADPTVDGDVDEFGGINTGGTDYFRMGGAVTVCAHSKTSILMADGTSKHIKGIKVGDFVASFDVEGERACVSEVLENNGHTASEYVIINGILRATSHHQILTSNGLKTVGELKVGNYLLGNDGVKIAVETIEKIEENVVVYELGLTNPSTYYADGFLVQSQLADVRGYVEWDISSIPDGAIITDTVFKYHGRQNQIDCRIREMLGYQPSLGDGSSIFTEAGEGTIYADPAGFPEVGATKQVDLGASADSDLQSQLSVDWFAIGIQAETEGSTSTSHIYAEEYDPPTPPPTLYVEYSLALGSRGYIIG